MRNVLKKIISVCFAAAVTASLSVSAFAEEYVYNFDDDTLMDEVKADGHETNGTEMTLEKELGDADSDSGMSVRCILFNEFIDPEFWNNPDVTVSIDVRLDTDADVIGYIIGFDSKWTWINPSDFTKLKYNEWITITETGPHFYEYLQKQEPLLLLFQTRSNWGADPQGDVKVTIRNFRISDGQGGTTVIPTMDASDTGEPASTTTSAADSGDNASSTPAPVGTTSSQTASAVQTSINYNDINLIESNAEKSTAMVFIVIIVIAAAVVVGIVVGYLIYKKKKYY